MQIRATLMTNSYEFRAPNPSLCKRTMPKNKTPNNLSNDTELLYMISVALTQRFKKKIISHSLIYYLFKGGSAVRISPRNHSVIFCSTQIVARQTCPICKGKQVPSAKKHDKTNKAELGVLQ